MRLDPVATRVEVLLAEVEIPVPFSVEEFCRRVAARRGRPIHLRAIDTVAVGLPSGTVFGRDDDDVILYDGLTSGYHQAGIILHEVGHLIAEHYAGSVVGEDAAEFLLPEIGRHQARRRADRESYTAQEEREAEYFARRVLELVSRRSSSTLDSELGSTFGE
ncbi:MAG: hypothetical protein ACR2JO_09700 [Mycobacteriales bacterium]